jgi:8-hydroxy-5-deazaflavin:NADPH oxidoreductase
MRIGIIGAGKIGGTLTVVVDTCNYYPDRRDGNIGPIDEGLPESRWVEQQLGRPVVKAFNNIVWSHLLEWGKAGRRARPPYLKKR